ncbi:MAG: DUF5018 domain-containing protein [Bacteroidales bacterium]
MKQAIRRTIWILLAAITTAAGAQNLLQNPGFESPDGWDSYWKLATEDPSTPSAMADAVTSDVYEGTRSVQLSNSVKLKWTYLYSDSVEAPITLRADKKYEVTGWIKVLEMGKEIDLSIFWNGSLESFQFCGDNPDPEVQPDWFMVKDTIYPQVHCSDAYLRLGFRSDKDGLFPTGRLLLDHFSVTRIPEITDTDITAFHLPVQAGETEIDYVTGTIRIRVPAGTDVTGLTPAVIAVSEGAVVSPSPDAAVDFSSPVHYTVTAKDGTTTQVWSVEVEILPNTGTDMLSFHIPGQAGGTQIDPEAGQVTVTMPFGSDLSSLVPDIGISEGAVVDPAGGTALDFSAPVPFTVTAEDGTTQQVWSVVVIEEVPSTEAEITGFEIPGQVGTAVIDEGSSSISVVMPLGTDVTSLVPRIDISDGATVDPAGSVETDFTAPLVYEVTAQDGSTSRRWMVTVSLVLNKEADIVAFSIGGGLRSAFSNPELSTVVIDPEKLTVTVEVPYGTDVTGLVPDIEVSAGATLDPAGGKETDFSAPVVYRVTAQDGMTVKDWTVTVNVLANSAASITGFTVEEQLAPASIDQDAHTVSLEVAPGTDLASIAPEVTVSSGAGVTPSDGEIVDFSSGVVYYTVTAEDGTVQEWTVTILMDPALSAGPGAGIREFRLYPNPAKTYVMADIAQPSDIFIQDLQGKVVVSMTDVSGNIAIPVSQLKRGLYLVTVCTGSRRQVVKLILD